MEDIVLSERLDSEQGREWAECLPQAFAQAESLADTPAGSIKAVPLPDGSGLAAVKHYPSRSARHQAGDRQRGTPAQRSWHAGRRLIKKGVGTPEPLALVRNQEGEWLATVAVEGALSLKQRLIHILRDTQDCEQLIDLLQLVADALRGMYAAGVLHGDLGNQNILLTSDQEGSSTVQFIDLDRSRIVEQPTLQEQARDLCRLYLPSEFRRVLHEMLFEGRPPKDFKEAEHKFRRAFDGHTRSRKWRHPIRERRRAQHRDPKQESYPDPTECWIYDEKSMQAITCMRSKERLKHTRLRPLFRSGWNILRDAPAVWKAWRGIQSEIFRDPIDMQGRFGCALEPTPERWPYERALIMDLPRFPVLVRFYHHKGLEGARPVAAAIRELHTAGFPVSVALVQCRRSVTDPSDWNTFCIDALDAVKGLVEQVEVGHATFRVKWGCWNGSDYGRLASVVPELRRRHPGVEFIGPAGIDFEYHRILETLGACDSAVHFDALSHHLYVDRRGEPEAEQHGYDTVRKCALARAIARAHRRTDDRFIVSEVNWPLMDTGVYSPTASPYLFPGQRKKSGTDETTYPHYLVRFALLAVCSGMAERIMWWTLGAHGFGLVDPLDGWRPRPAYHAFARWLNCMEGARFLRREQEGSLQRYVFSRSHGPDFEILYAWPESTTIDLSGYARIERFSGQLVDPSADYLLTGEPLIAENQSV